MTNEERVVGLFEACKDLIGSEGAGQVQHYLQHGEHEMALEGLVLELIAENATPPDFDFAEWEALARQLGIPEDPVFDGDFWEKFREWGQQRTG